MPRSVFAFAGILTMFAAQPGLAGGYSLGDASVECASGKLAVEWYFETPATEQHLYREIAVSPCGKYLYVADLWEDAVLIFKSSDPMHPIRAITHPSWGKTNVFPYGVGVADDGKVYIAVMDYFDDGVNDNILWRCRSDGSALTPLCELPENPRGIQVLGSGFRTIVFVAGNYGLVMRCTPTGSNTFGVEQLFDTNVFRNQQDVCAFGNKGPLFLSSWSKNNQDPDGTPWSLYESEITKWGVGGKPDTKFSVSYLPLGNVSGMVESRQGNRLYFLHMGFDPLDQEMRVYEVDGQKGKLLDQVTLGPGGTSGGGGLDIDSHGDLYVAQTLEIRNGFRISTIAKITDRKSSAHHGAVGLADNEIAEELDTPVPTSVELQQNYPNPFNPSTTVRFALAGPGWVKLSVYNSLGQEVGVLHEGMKEAGYHEIRWDATGFPSGVYLCRLEAQGTTCVRLMALVR
jgi:hypothetical protein